MSSEQELRTRDDAPPTTARDADDEGGAAGREDESAIVGRTVTIDRPREEIYAFWRDFPNLAAIMENIERIDTIDDEAHRTGWSRRPAARRSNGIRSITDDEPGRLIAWQSVEGADVANSRPGRVPRRRAGPRHDGSRDHRLRSAGRHDRRVDRQAVPARAERPDPARPQAASSSSWRPAR